MKVKFTLQDMDAIEAAYWNNEGYMPCKIDHVPQEAEYRVLQELWLRMAKRLKKEREENED